GGRGDLLHPTGSARACSGGAADRGTHALRRDRSGVERLGAVIHAVLNAQADGRVDVQLVEPGGISPEDFLRFAARAQLAADRSSAKADGELLADLAVRERDHVLWVAVDPDQAGHVD